MEAASIFSRTGIAPARYKNLLDSLYGEDWYKWDSDTLRQTLEADKHGPVDDLAANKIRAVQMLRISNKCYTDFRVFEKIVLALNDIPIDWDMVELAEPEEVGYAIHEIKNIYPDAEFGREVAAYIAAICAQEGFVILPPPLEFAQDELDKANRGTLAIDARDVVREAIKKAKVNGQWKDSGLLGNALSKYASVLAFIKKKSGALNG